MSEVTTPPLSAMWSSTIPNFQVAWDSTSLGLLKECPRKYQYQIILHKQSRGLNVHLTFGLLYHAALERYDHSRAAGGTHDQALHSMVRYALTASGTWSVERGDGERVELTPHTAADGELDFTDETGAQLGRPSIPIFTPWPSTDPIKNRYTLLRSVVWNVETFQASQLETVILSNGKPAVELSFKFSAFEVASEPITLCGHMDKLVRQKGTDYVWVQDHKTTKAQLDARFYGQFSPHNQFTLYTIAGKVVLDQPNCQGVMVRGAQIGVGFTRFGERPIPRAPAVLNEWLEDTQYWITQAHKFAVENHWPQNDKSCGNYGGCSFAKVCSVSPTHRPAWLAQDFADWTWDPTVARGDI